MVQMMSWYSILTFQDHTSVTGSDELAHNDVASQLLLPPTCYCLPIQLVFQYISTHCHTVTLHNTGVNSKQGKAVPVHVMKAKSGMEVKHCSFLTVTLGGGEWSAVCPDCFTPSPKKDPATHWIRGRMCPRASRESSGDEKISHACHKSNPGYALHITVTIMTEFLCTYHRSFVSLSLSSSSWLNHNSQLPSA